MRPAALALSVGIFGAALAVTAPAQACSCSYRGVESSLAAGHAVAIVTGEPRKARPGWSDGAATFRIEGSAGPALPARLKPRQTGDGCGFYVPPGPLTALVFERRPGSSDWYVGGCAESMLPSALHRILGDAVAVQGGAPVAYAAGEFGGARLTALDRQGRTVAFDSRPGRGEQVAVCPGGRTVAAVGMTRVGEREWRRELTVHDARDLGVRRSVTLPRTTGATVFAVRCADPGGRVVEVAVGGYSDVPNRVLTVAGRAVTTQAFDTIRAAAPMPDGMLLAVGDQSTSLLHVRPDGTRTAAVLQRVHLETDGSLAVSPDGRTAAVAGYLDSWRSPLLTLDLGTGRQLGAWTERPTVTGLAWAGPDRLLVRAEHRDHSGPPTLHVLDRTLTRVDEHPVPTGVWGTHFGAVGRNAVLYGNGARLTTVPESGYPLVADALRLAAAAHVAGVPGREFVRGATAPVVLQAPGENGAVRVVVIVVAGLGVLRVLAGLVFVRRQRRMPA